MDAIFDQAVALMWKHKTLAKCATRDADRAWHTIQWTKWLNVAASHV